MSKSTPEDVHVDEKSRATPELAVHDVEQLLDLGDEVGRRIRYLHKDLGRYRIQAFGSLLAIAVVMPVAFLALQPTELQPLVRQALGSGAAIICLTCALWSFIRMNSLLELRREAEVEGRVMRDLVHMSSSLIESMPDTVPIITRTVLRLRITRMRFSALHHTDVFDTMLQPFFAALRILLFRDRKPPDERVRPRHW